MHYHLRRRQYRLNNEQSPLSLSPSRGTIIYPNEDVPKNGQRHPSQWAYIMSVGESILHESL